MKKTLCGVAVSALTCLLGSVPAYAENLNEVLAQAYMGNPTLEAQRASLRATDENINQARSGWLPSITANGSVSYQDTQTDSLFGASGSVYPKRASVTLQQNIFTGFQTVNNTKQARKQVEAARQNLLDTEQSVLLDAVSAYVDVKRDEVVLELTKNNVMVLQRQLEASEDRFRVGEITRTDVAQSKARLSGAITERIQAEANLTASRSAFIRVVGGAPGTLEDIDALPPLPASEEAALDIALRYSPTLNSAKYVEEAARYNVNSQYGGLSPTVSLEASYNKSWDASTVTTNVTSKEVVARMTVPLYQSGAQSSRIRQAKQLESQRRLEVIAAERQVRENVQNAWEGYREATARIGSTQSQVEANEIALDGVRQEAEVGSRTTLDVLDAEQELLQSRVENVRSHRDQVVAAYRLLLAMGKLTAQDLQLEASYYDASKNTDKVDDKIYGFGIDSE
ncbi:TolC family outer membrane protein [Emcibacter sp.]|uniref:TolC family outer membrane protein n=1 Tax=Emcibacter sp. TaxID=1979954 RepID=UPI002AA93D3E|nr:TolC family outer membrane protein [Emcibacter sp.]